MFLDCCDLPGAYKSNFFVVWLRDARRVELFNSIAGDALFVQFRLARAARNRSCGFSRSAFDTCSDTWSDGIELIQSLCFSTTRCFFCGNAASRIFLAMGTAFSDPWPEFSTMIAMAIVGFLKGANATNQACGKTL